MKWFALTLILSATQVMAACPALPIQSEKRADLLQQLRTADTYTKGAAAVTSMWMFWRVAPDEIAQEMLDNGLSSIHIANYIAAEEILARLVQYCTDSPEGHNQLAFAYFLQGKYDQSLASLDRTLELEPLQFGALSGKALIYQAQGREDIAQIFLRRAVAVNPWLNERFMLRSDQGTDDI